MSKNQFFVVIAIVALSAFLFMRYMQQNNPSSKPIGSETAAGITPPEFSSWREFFSPTGHFRVLLPTLPQHAKDNIVDSKTHESHKHDTFVSVSVEKAEVFMVSIIKYPQPISPDVLKETLQSVVDDVLNRNKENKLESMTMNDFKGHKALDFVILNNDSRIVGKVFADKATIYLLSLVTKESPYESKDYDYFIDSLVLQHEIEQKNNKDKTEKKP